MKTLHLTLLLFTIAIMSSCNSKKSDTESSIENSETSVENATEYEEGTARNTDSMIINNNSQRMSDGKDSVEGEVTPPNASKQ